MIEKIADHAYLHRSLLIEKKIYCQSESEGAMSMYKILLIGSLLLSGCASHYVIENYNGFVRIANGHIDSELMEDRGLQEEEVRNINEEEDMYVYVDSYGCKFGYIVDRNDPDKKIKSWVLFQNKESCNMLALWRRG